MWNPFHRDWSILSEGDRSEFWSTGNRNALAGPGMPERKCGGTSPRSHKGTLVSGAFIPCRPTWGGTRVRAERSTKAQLIEELGTLRARLTVVERAVPERERAEVQHRESCEHMLASRLQSAREEQRAQTARRIRDELGHTLTALKKGLWWLQNMIARPGDLVTDAPMRGRVESMIELLEGAIQSLRNLATELRSAVLDLGLCESIE